MDDTIATVLPMLPLPGGVVVPQMVVNVGIETAEAHRAVDAAATHDRQLVLVPKLADRYADVGTVVTVEEDARVRGGRRVVVVRGSARARIGQARTDEASGVLVVDVQLVDEETPATADVEALSEEYRAVVAELLERRGAGQVADAIAGIAEPGQLADTAVYSPDLSLERKVELLETVDVVERLGKALAWAKETLANAQLRDKVQRDAMEGLEGRQREALLREQMAAIRRELGDGDEDEVAQLRQRADVLPEQVRAAANKELDRLERVGEQSPEHAWIRTWLDTVFEVPWNERTDDTGDVDVARAVLDADHEGLDDVKERILEFLAVRRLRAERGQTRLEGRGDGATLALVGPPGVGKTSLGESVARALGRRFVRVALGGVRDEAEIRGHRRTYVGARPGRIVRALSDAGTMNPVVLLDEVDKLGADWRGDPTSALLEVLDPAQNHTFRDHYLEIELDLSDVLFLATANVLDTIPAPLRDRLEIVRIDGYTDAEKVQIARRHLVPRQRRRAGLVEGEFELSDDVVAAVIEGWTREPGVRELERKLGRMARKKAAGVARGVEGAQAIDPDDLRDVLGRPLRRDDPAIDDPEAGVVTGLAVTGTGGDVLAVEASVARGDEGISVTGQLGDVMRESAELAYAYVRGHAAAVGVDDTALAGRHVHLHVPAGAVPKDGPSAGITMVTALVSALREEAPARGVGMTGEVSLRGRVLPIGGLTPKLLAAQRAGLTDVVIPDGNAEDLEDVPEETRAALRVHLARTVDDVLRVGLPTAVLA